MKKRNKSEFKGFGKQPLRKYKRFKCSGKEMIPMEDCSDPVIDNVLERIEEVTKYNQSRPDALENFKKLVAEGDTEKLTEYFEQYGISPDVSRFSLNILIAEELRDLSA